MVKPDSATALPLILTKLLPPRISRDFIARPLLVERLEWGLRHKLTLVSAPAGYGKSTILSSWLEHSPRPSSWLSLDEHDSDLRVFVAYLVAALQSVAPGACKRTEELLNGPEPAPFDYLAASLVNEIAVLPEPFVLVLDDYHRITGTRVHQFVATLLQYQPRQMHLVIATRRDPYFSTVQLRANQEMTELRLDDLRFTVAEVKDYLERCLEQEVTPETVAIMASRTEGWIVGLRLACLALRRQADIPAFLNSFQGTHRYIMQYLLDEVLAVQPEPVQEFLLCSAILERFSAPLCEAILGRESAAGSQGRARPPAEETLAELERANLFLISLDQTGEWYRYHHLFQELLRHKLRQEYSEHDLAALHTTAGSWLAENGYGKEALDHFLAAGEVARAAEVVSRQRYALMNETQWQQLSHLLGRFPPDAVSRIPDLLMLKLWLQYHRGHNAELPALLQQLDQTLIQATLSPAEITHLLGEMSALRSLCAYLMVDPQSAIAAAQQSIETTPKELWIVRVLARLCLAGALQMTGDLQAAYDVIYRSYAEDEAESDTLKATVLVAACSIYWVAADLHGLEQTADHARELSHHAMLPQMQGWTHYNLGCVAFHRNDLAAAEHHFAWVVQQPYLNYGDCYAHSACGLALTYQAQDRPAAANEIADAAVRFMLSTGNTSLLSVIEALQAELALRQGRVSVAWQWADRFVTAPPLRPEFRFLAPHLTLAKVWLADDTAAGQARAAGLLAQLRTFFESTHNSRFLIEVLALQSLQQRSPGQLVTDALADLERALALAQPGGFVRLFVDLGSGMARLLADLRSADGERTEYIDQILAAFPSSLPRAHRSDGKQAFLTAATSMARSMVEPLTNRELEVLALLSEGLSDQELAQRLVISPHTVRTHLKHIFAKLEVGNRREAVVRADQLGLLSPG